MIIVVWVFMIDAAGTVHLIGFNNNRLKKIVA